MQRVIFNLGRKKEQLIAPFLFKERNKGKREKRTEKRKRKRQKKERQKEGRVKRR